MILGNLETLCLSIFVLLLILLITLFALALLKRPRQVPGRYLKREDAPPLPLDTVFKLNHYFPLPNGFAYTEDDNGAPIIVRIDDGLVLPYRMEEALLIFEEPYLRPDGKTGTRTHELFRQHKPVPTGGPTPAKT